MDDWIGAAFSAGMGALLIVMGIPLIRRLVPPNRFYGFRTSLTSGDPAIWYAVNALTGKCVICTGVVLVMLAAAGLAAINDREQQELLILVALAVLALGIFWALYSGWRLSKQLTAQQ